MSRLPNMHDNKASEMVAALVADVTEFKNTQRTSGQSGVLGYSSQSTATWDLTGTVGLSSDASTRVTVASVIFTGDGSQIVSMANLACLVYVNGTDPAHQLTPQNPNWTDGTRTANISYVTLDISRNLYTQQIVLTTLKDVTYYFKASAVASCRGTVVVTL